MKGKVTLFEHPGCPLSHFNVGAMRRCKNKPGTMSKWVQKYTQGDYYLLTPEEVETIHALREGKACIQVNTGTTVTRQRSTTTETSPET